MNYYTIMFYVFFAVIILTGLTCMYKIAITDWRRRIIPDAYLFPLLISGLITAAFLPGWPNGIHAAIIGGAFGYALAALIGFIFDYRMRRKNPDITAPIGMGDIKLIFVGGIWLGTRGLAWALVIACVLGYIWGRKSGNRYIPFAPFFIVGGILSFIGLAFLL